MVNKVIAMYLHCVTSDHPHVWVDWLSWAEYCYNTSFHSTLRTSPFKVVYGGPLLPLLAYRAGSARTDAIDSLLHDRDEALADIHEQLLQAQQLSKNNTTTPLTMSWSSWWVTGCGRAFFIG